MDIFNMTLVGLVALGAVNVISFFKPDMDSRVKFAISVVVAFVVAFIPPDLGNIVLDKLRLALEAALAASGTYKLFTKAGGA
jgi:hypothetical protein